MYEKNIQQAKLLEASSTSELGIYKEIKSMSISELIDKGYSLEVANKIKNEELEETILQEFFERVSLPEDTLSNMGYTKEEIQKMKSLTGEETLSEIEALGVSAKVTCYNYLISHYYEVQKNKTYFIVGFGWNHEFAPENLSSSYNKQYITYVNKNYPSDSSDVQFLTHNLVKEGRQTSESMIDMEILHGMNYYFAKSGTGVICLSQTGKILNAKFMMKYGHDEDGAAPFLEYPWDGLSLTEAESMFQPPKLVYSATPTEVN